MAVVTIYDEKFHALVQSQPRILEYAQSPIEAPTSPGKHEGCSCERCNARLNRLQVINKDDSDGEEKVSLEDGRTLRNAEPSTEIVHVNNYTIHLGEKHGKAHIASSEGQVILVHRCLLAGKKQAIVNLKQSLFELRNPRWCLLMLGGGHFAAGIFDASGLLQHKTFHTYTVRAGQGGTQSSKDNKNRASAPKSAGATLRRANEQALAQEVASVLDSWREELQRCTAIFLRAPGPCNKNMLFGGKNPPLQRGDPRLRVVPFVTGRATLKELKRIQEVLASATIYESLDAIPATPDDNEDTRRSKTKGGSTNRAKSRESVERPLPVPPATSDRNESDSCSSDPDDMEDSVSDDDDDISNSLEDLQVSFEQSLNHPESPISDAPLPRKKPPNEKTRKHQERQAQIKEAAARAKEEQKLAIRVGQAIENNDVSELNVLLQTQPAFIDLVINIDEDTPLHACAKRENTELLELLLANGADVCAKNAKHQTPYSCTQSKSVREIFKKFAQEHPDKHNYPKAQIPVVPKLTDEQLEAKNKRAKEQKKAKRDRYKENKKVRQEEQEEQQERERFAQLSDREKRALVAERRILDARGTVTSRCFLCGNDMGGKAGFEYSNNKFCTVECLKAHRLKNPVVLS